MWGRFIRVMFKPFNAAYIMGRYWCLWVYRVVIIVILY